MDSHDFPMKSWNPLDSGVGFYVQQIWLFRWCKKNTSPTNYWDIIPNPENHIRSIIIFSIIFPSCSHHFPIIFPWDPLDSRDFPMEKLSKSSPRCLASRLCQLLRLAEVAPQRLQGLSWRKMGCLYHVSDRFYVVLYIYVCLNDYIYIYTHYCMNSLYIYICMQYMITFITCTK